jgi:predicted nucleic acid-binding protein
VTRTLVDTNIFLRASDASSLHHAVCVSALSSLATPAWEAFVCAQVIIEFWAVATRPRSANGLGLSIADAEKTVGDILNTFQCLDEPPKIIEVWRDLAFSHRVAGKQSHDTRLVAIMQAQGVGQLISINDADFKRFSEIVCVTPDQVAGSATP